VAKDSLFDIDLCLRKFAKHCRGLFKNSDLSFLGRQEKMLFLSYLAPLFNGGGFARIESQFGDCRRMDIVVDYNCAQSIIELKTWHGEEAHDAGYAQFTDSCQARGYREVLELRLICETGRTVSRRKSGSTRGSPSLRCRVAGSKNHSPLLYAGAGGAGFPSWIFFDTKATAALLLDACAFGSRARDKMNVSLSCSTGTALD
jgi:hypothetical protein